MDNSKCGMQKNSDQVDALLYLVIWWEIKFPVDLSF